MKDVKKSKIDRDKAIRSNTAKHRRKRRRNLSLYYFLMTLLTVSVLVVLSLTVFFKISDISVEGDSAYSDTAIIKRSGIEAGTNLIMLNGDRAADNILNDFILIDEVEIKKKFPSSVVITVTAAENYFQVLTDSGKYLTVSSNFKVLDSASERDEGLFLVENSGITNAEKGSLVKEQLGGKADTIRSITETFKLYGIDNINNITFISSADIRVTVLGGRITVKLGSESKLEYKIQLVSEVINTKIAENETGVIDASVEGTASFRPQ